MLHLLLLLTIILIPIPIILIITIILIIGSFIIINTLARPLRPVVAEQKTILWDCSSIPQQNEQ